MTYLVVGFVAGAALAAGVAALLAMRRAESAHAELEARQQDLDALGRSELRLARALDAIPHGVVICDGDGQVVFHNAHGAQYSAARHGDALVEAAIRELLLGAVGGRSQVDTVELFGPPRRTLVITAAPLGAEASGEGAVAVIDDVTERRHLEAVRRDFVANISHELKTPVGAIALLAETLDDESDPEVAQRLAGRIVSEAHRVGRTIEDLLELSSLEREGQHTTIGVRVGDVIEAAVARIAPAAENRSIEVRCDPAASDAVVHGDRIQLVSALFNLLENAVKYSPDGSAVEVRADRHDDHVDLVVTDHGIGIPTRDLERVFERFYRVDQARSRDTGGTGLGLAIVRHVVTNHRGEVLVSSREGEGSTFTLRIPTTAHDPEGAP